MNLVLITAAVGVALSAAAYIYGRHDGRELATAAAAREERVAAVAAQAAASAAVGAIRTIRVQNTTIQGRVEREVQTLVEYRDCRHPDGVFDDINEALTGVRANRDAAAGVPASGAAR